MRKYFFIFANYIVFAYAYFKIITKEADSYNTSIFLYVIMSIIASGQILKYRLYFKRRNAKMTIFMLLIYFLIILLFVFLFQSYNYNFLNYIWWLVAFVVLIVFAEFQYYFLTVEQLEELNNIGFFKNKKDDDSKKD